MREFMFAAALAISVCGVLPPIRGQQRGPRLDSYGDPLPPGAVLRLGTKRLQTKGGFAWTPDGKSLITMKHGTVYFWDLADGHLSQTLSVPIDVDPFHTYGSQLALSRDGKLLVCTDWHGAIATWNLETLELASQPAVNKSTHEENNSLAIAPNGQSFVTLRRNGELQFRSPATCAVTRKLKLPEGHLSEDTPVAFSPDGRTLAVGSDRAQSIYLVDVERLGEPAVIEKAHDSALYNFKFLADGRLCSVGTGKEVLRLSGEWEPANQLRIWELKGDKELNLRVDWPMDESLPSGCSAAFSPDGRIMVTVHEDRIAVWDAKMNEIVRIFAGLYFRNPMHAQVAIDPLGKFVAINDRENYVRIFDLATGEPILSTNQHHLGHVLAVAWSPDGETIVTAGSGGEVRLWESATGARLHQFRGPTWGVLSLKYSPDGSQLVLGGDQWNRPRGAADGPVQWRDADTGRLIREHVLPARARLVTPSPDQSLVAVASYRDLEPGGEKSSVRIIEAVTGNERGKIMLGDDVFGAHAIRWSLDGSTIHVVTDTKVIRADVETTQTTVTTELPHQHRERHTGALGPGSMRSAVFLRGGAGLVTSGSLPEIYGWKLPSGEKEWTIKVEANWLHSLAISSDERMLAAVVDHSDEKHYSVRVFDIAARRELARFDVGRDRGERLAFSPDGRRLLFGMSDGSSLVYEVSAARDQLSGEP